MDKSFKEAGSNMGREREAAAAKRFPEVRVASDTPVQGPQFHDLGEQLAPLCRHLAEDRLKPLGVRLWLCIEPALIEVERCWRVGLVVELIIEYLARYAFQGRGGIILVDVTADAGVVFCRLSNNGDPTAAAQGRGAVLRLVEKLGGRINWRATDKGSAALLTFPVPGPTSSAAGDSR